MQKKNEREEAGPGDNGKIIIMARWRVVSEMQKAEKQCLHGPGSDRKNLANRVYTLVRCARVQE